MHELSIADHLLSLLETSARQQGFQQVHRLVLGIGRFSCVDQDTLLHCIRARTAGTLLAEADIEWRTIDAEAECTHCHQRFVPDEWPCLCPCCGTVSSRLTAGRDLVLESMEVS